MVDNGLQLKLLKATRCVAGEGKKQIKKDMIGREKVFCHGGERERARTTPEMRREFIEVLMGCVRVSWK